MYRGYFDSVTMTLCNLKRKGDVMSSQKIRVTGHVLMVMYFLVMPSFCSAGILDIIRTRSDFNSKVLGNHDPKILLFSAEWCRYCDKLKPVVEKVRQEYAGNPEVYIIDVESLARLAQDYRIRGVPTLVVVREGEEQGRLVGYNEEEIIRSLFDKNFK